jgi:hypothetical protein
MTAILLRTILLYVSRFSDDNICVLRISRRTGRATLLPVSVRRLHPGLGSQLRGPDSASLGQGATRREWPGGRRLRYRARVWAEERATRGRDPSADPGAKTGVGGTTPPLGIPGLARKRSIPGQFLK